MGLFDFIKNEFIEVIDWVDDSNNTVLYKFPDKGNKIMNGAQLTVRESQVAVLMNEGEFGDEYKPGRHELTTSNMPLTTTLKSWKYLFDSPFKVDVFFVNTKLFTNLKWGTSNPIIMRDPEFKQVRVRSFGTFTIKVKDAKKFITEFAGTNSWVPIDAISEQCRNAIIGKLGEGLAEAGVSVLDLAANFTEIGNKLKPIFQTDFDAWGIELGQFYIENVSLPEEVEKWFDKATQLNMMDGKLNQFNQMQAGIALEKMADNPGSGDIGSIGTGILLNNMLQGQLGQQQMQQQQPQNSGNTANAGNDHQKMIDLLKQLGELKSAGVITEEEFNQKKAEILGKL